MKKNYSIILAFLSVVVLFVPNNVFAQKGRLITIESVVTDKSGNPIENAEIFSNTAYTKTDVEGRFSISIEPGTNLLVEAKGFIDLSLTPDVAMNLVRITLEASEYLYGRDKKVDLAFRKAFEGDIVGAVSIQRTSEIAGIDFSVWGNDILTGRTVGMLGSNNIRGIGININVADITGSGLNSGNALFIVDGLPRDIESLRLSEIDNITVLKDVNAAILYGSAAVNGVILITTKRGEAFKSTANFTGNYGIQTPRTMPKYLSSADYMTYYNQAVK